MNKMFIIIETVLMLTFLVACGFISIKSKYLTQQTSAGLAKLITRVIFPGFLVAVILSPDLTIVKIKGSLPLFIISIIAISIFWGLSFVFAFLFKLPKNELPAFVYMTTFLNAVFMGFPLVTAIYGMETALYISVIAIGQDVVLWIFGMLVLDRFRVNGEKRKFSINPITIAFLIAITIKLIGIKIPMFIYSPIKSVTASTPYLAMLYLGMALANSNVKAVIKKWQTYMYLLLKLFLYPLIAGILAFFVFKPFLEPLQITVFLIIFSTPTMISLSAVFKEYDLNGEYASGLIFLGTVGSAISIPIIYYFTNLIFK